MKHIAAMGSIALLVLSCLASCGNYQADRMPSCKNGATQTCGTNLGACKKGTQTCVDGFWSDCEDAVAPSVELCDGEDNDCDGDVDEGYGAGEACQLPGGCPGELICDDGGTGTTCVVDPAATSDEICDGVDNDCDGYVDFAVDAARVFDACQCVEQPLTFGSVPEDRSQATVVPTECDGTGEALTMSFSIDCKSDPFAMCESPATIDLGPFARGSRGRALTVHFTLESDTEVKVPINLYYQVGTNHGDIRRYFPLLDVGEPAGAYTRVFMPEHTCYPKATDVDCVGTTTEGCNCGPADSCGLEEGSDCDQLLYGTARLQVAVEWCSDTSDSAPEFQGVIHVHEIYYGPLVCDDAD